MRVAILAPVWFPVPPTGYGGIEWVVALLADGLVAAGHDVTLFASGDSRTKAALAAVYPEAPSGRIGDSSTDLRHAISCYERADDFDVVNDHSGPLGATVGAAVATPVVHTVHGPLEGAAREIYEGLARIAPEVALVSLSLNQRKPAPGLPWIANCPNALDLDAYPYHEDRGEYLLFLGRMTPEKGCHRAIEVARRTGLPLKIAGKKRERLEQEYFDSLVRPHLGDGIEYLGETSHLTKVALLQNARVTLFPIEWEEPFGLVMIESMACGTPVVATRWGAVPEVIEHGRSGLIVDGHPDMVDAIAEADRLQPSECRRYVEERFSARRMVADYEAVYERLAELGANVVADPRPARDRPRATRAPD
jgi:glycosyltransferase involved in cell wall biosynthesis